MMMIFFTERSHRSVAFDELGLTMVNGNAGGRYYAANANRTGRGVIAPSNRVDLPPVIPTLSHDVTSADSMTSSRVEDCHVALRTTQLSTSHFTGHSVAHHCTCHVTSQHGNSPCAGERIVATKDARRRVTEEVDHHAENEDDRQPNSGQLMNGIHSEESHDEEDEL